MKKLLIAGCSWSCGEWENVPNTNTLFVSHPGMEEYLNKSFNVVNASVASGSNWDICYSIENYIRHTVAPVDNLAIVVFQTDAMRISRALTFDVDYNTIIKNSTNINDLYISLIEIFYIKLNNIAQQHQRQIYLVGGLTDLETNIISLYPNLRVLCPSWIKLLSNQHEPSLMPLVLNKDGIKLLKDNGRLDMCEEYFSISDSNFIKLQKLFALNIFGPAYADFHPNRDSHKKMANFILEYFQRNA